MPDLEIDKANLIVMLANLLTQARLKQAITANRDWQQGVDDALEKVYQLISESPPVDR